MTKDYSFYLVAGVASFGIVGGISYLLTQIWSWLK